MKYNYYKSSILLIVLICSAMSVSAQSAIQRHFEKYSEDDRFTRITISAKMFQLFANFEVDGEDGQEMIQTISKLKGLKMLIGDDLDGAPMLFKQISKMPEKDMDELMRVEKEESELRFFIQEKSDGVISELLMIALEERGLIMMSIVGDIDLKSMSKLSKHMNIEGFEKLENVGGEQNKDD
ncbi:MAG: hypothetical protein ACI8XB_001143 [Patiriisocius sp.]|jgi:hypothetical protein